MATLLEIQLALDGVETIHPNTTKLAKIQKMLTLLRECRLDNIELEVLNWIAKDYVESDDPNALKVAREKAEWIQHRLGRDESGKQPVTVGFDVAFHFLTDKGWQNWSKLERYKRPLTIEEIMIIRRDLFTKLVMPDSHDGKIRMAWQNAMSIKNGSAYDLCEWICVIAKPIPVEKFNQHFEQAVLNGMLYSSNSRLAMMEVLMESMVIEKVAVIDNEVFKRGVDLNKYFMTPESQILNLLLEDIIGVVPHALFVIDEPKYLLQNPRGLIYAREN